MWPRSMYYCSTDPARRLAWAGQDSMHGDVTKEYVLLFYWPRTAACLAWPRFYAWRCRSWCTRNCHGDGRCCRREGGTARIITTRVSKSAWGQHSICCTSSLFVGVFCSRLWMLISGPVRRGKGSTVHMYSWNLLVFRHFPTSNKWELLESINK